MLSRSTIYAFIFFVVTAALLCNKRVKMKYLEIGELIAAVVLFFSVMITGALVRSPF